MTYEKMQAEVIIFDNSDVLTASACSKKNSKNNNNCGHQTSGNSCNQNGTKKFDNCLSLNHSACPADLGK